MALQLTITAPPTGPLSLSSSWSLCAVPLLIRLWRSLMMPWARRIQRRALHPSPGGWALCHAITRCVRVLMTAVGLPGLWKSNLAAAPRMWSFQRHFHIVWIFALQLSCDNSFVVVRIGFAFLHSLEHMSGTYVVHFFFLSFF